jgi:hypothetical protein
MNAGRQTTAQARIGADRRGSTAITADDDRGRRTATIGSPKKDQRKSQFIRENPRSCFSACQTALSETAARIP